MEIDVKYMEKSHTSGSRGEAVPYIEVRPVIEAIEKVVILCPNTLFLTVKHCADEYYMFAGWLSTVPDVFTTTS